MVTYMITKKMLNIMDREIGYYWVKWKESENWFISYWCGNAFWVNGDDFSEDCFGEIDERQIKRQE